MAFEQRIAALGGLKADEMIEKFQDLIEEVCSTSTLSNLNKIVEYLLTESNHIHNTVIKACLLHLAMSISPINSHELREVAEFTVSEIKKSVSNYDEADFAIREALFTYFLSHGMWTEGAEVLGGANFDSSELSDIKKADTYIKCAEAYLEDNAGYEAENYVNKASPLMKDSAVAKDWQLQLRYRVVFARVLDSNKKFTDAALRYYHLSNTQGELEVEEEDLLDLYGKAMACAILGKIGPQRTRVLALLQKDPRLNFIGTRKPKYEAHCSLLVKMRNGNLINPKELEVFSKSILPHQNAGAGNGFSIPENAVLEHNLFVAGNIYDNISLKELGKLLSLDVVSAERVTCRMISEGRLQANINQEDGFLYFNPAGGSSNDLCTIITRICDQVNDCVELIEASRSLESVA